MAEEKTSFLLYCDLVHLIRKMVKKDEKDNTNNAGLLFLHILEYVNDTDPEPINDLIELYFEPIKQQLKRDLQKWDKIKIVKANSGKLGGLKSGETRKANALFKKQNEANEANASNLKQNEANEAVSVSVSVSDNVVVNVNDKKEREEKPPQIQKIPPAYHISIDDCEKTAAGEPLWVESILMRHKLTPAQFTTHLSAFCLKLKADGEQTKDLPDFRQHFNNWLAIELNRTKNGKSNNNQPEWVRRQNEVADLGAEARRLLANGGISKPAAGNPI